MATNRDPIEALLDKFEPRVRQAFLDAIARIADKVSIKALEDRLRAGDIEGAIRAIGLDPNDFSGLRNAIVDAYGAGGAAVTETIPAARGSDDALIKVLFDIRSPRAEAWARDKSSGLITEIVDDQRNMIRANMRAGLEAGRNPRETALDIVGRIDPKTKLRSGGVIGLTTQQEAWQRNYAAELVSSDPAELRKALGRGLRDKRFDAAVLRAIKDGKPIPAETRAKMITAYRNRSLKYRADTISRTETIRALGAAKIEAYEQAIDKGQVKEQDLLKFPISAHDERVRETHREVERLNRKGVPWRQPYAVPAGMTPQMHAPYDEPQCRCREEVKINYLRKLGSSAGPVSAPSPAPASRPPEKPKVDVPALDAAAKAFVLENGRREGREFLRAFDLATGAVLEDNSGEKSNVGISTRTQAALRDPMRAIMIHHNHPGSTSFSDQDLRMLVHLPGLKGLWAHGPDGSSYYAEAVVKLTDQEAKRKIDAASRFVLGRMKAKLNEFGAGSVARNKLIDQFAASHSHVMSLVLHKLGVLSEYKYELAGSRKLSSTVRSFLSDVIAEAERILS